VRVHALDLLVVSAAALILSALAARMPARRAASLIPAEALRWE
jgi:ABC-type lipoprotein release transport system permease subunit